MLCRNDIRLTSTELSKLKCKYVTNKSSFLKIAPLKLEEAYLKPYIVIYHDVLYEIEIIKKMANTRINSFPYSRFRFCYFHFSLKVQTSDGTKS